MSIQKIPKGNASKAIDIRVDLIAECDMLLKMTETPTDVLNKLADRCEAAGLHMRAEKIRAKIGENHEKTSNT